MEYFLNVTLMNFFDKTRTCPELRWCLTSILSSQIRGTEPKFGTKHGRHNLDFHDLMVAQHAIGWEQLFQGRFDNRWSRLQEDHLNQNGELKLDSKYFSGNIWLRKLIALLWTTVRTCWDHRNDSCHGTNKEKRKKNTLSAATAC
jgi:hypothetical protein